MCKFVIIYSTHLLFENLGTFQYFAIANNIAINNHTHMYFDTI